MDAGNVVVEPTSNGEDVRRVEALFHAAADLPEGERGAFLDGACGSDALLRGRVERLLDRLGEDISLTSPMGEGDRAVSRSAESVMTEGPGSVIDRYKLLQVIGEGGFGVVYMAEQQAPVVRKVALKIIKLGMDTREVVARFEAERQALALMDHPNIAQVLDGGATDSGRPYFVMELVRGVSITQFCNRNTLSTGQRLELFSAVCRAVQHAHQKGVIHRDLKPSNVMVTLRDGVPIPKVIDFGVAKAMHSRLTDKTLFTRYEQFVGTPAYMSPEQAEMSALDLDTRTDIYSLGVLLYELLTGTTPFDDTTLRRAGLAEIQRIIREEQPVRPSVRISATPGAAAVRHGDVGVAGLSRVLRGDLDWIVMKALEKDRGRRYATAGDMAEDIRRHLANEPVIAGPPGAGYRVRKFLARHRAAVASFALIALALVVGMIATSTAMVKSRRNAEMATEQADRAMSAVNFLLSTLSLTNPEVAQDPDVSVQTLLDHASAEVADEFAGFPGVEVRVRATIGRAYRRLGQFEQAESHLRRVVEIVGEHSEEDGSFSPELPAAGFDEVEYYTALWALTHVCFNLERSDSFEVAAHAQRVALHYIAETEPELSASLADFMEVIEANAWSLSPDAMDGVAEQFAAVAAQAEAVLPAGDPAWPMVADTFLAAGYTLWYTPHEPLNLMFWGKALDIQRRELPSHHPDIANTVGLLVGVLNMAGRYDEAEALIRESVNNLRAAHPEGVIAIAFAEGLLGETLVKQQRYEEAEPVLLRSHAAILKGVMNASNFLALESFNRVVELYDSWGRPEEAAPYRDAMARAVAGSKHVQAWAVIRGAFGPGFESLVESAERLNGLCGGVSYTAKHGERTDAGIEAAARGFVELQGAVLDKGEPRAIALARLMLGWANALDPVEQVEARRLLAEGALERLRPRAAEFPLDSSEAASVLAACARVGGDRAGAKSFAQESWRAVAGMRPGGDWIRASREVRIARSLLAEGMDVQAEELLQRACEVLRVQLGEHHSDTEVARSLLHELSSRRRESGEARHEQQLAPAALPGEGSSRAGAGSMYK
jgi:tetratricopeptide (TPR) repeat protein